MLYHFCWWGIWRVRELQCMRHFRQQIALGLPIHLLQTQGCVYYPQEEAQSVPNYKIKSKCRRGNSMWGTRSLLVMSLLSHLPLLLSHHHQQSPKESPSHPCLKHSLPFVILVTLQAPVLTPFLHPPPPLLYSITDDHLPCIFLQHS